MSQTRFIYLIHFDRPFKHAKHYIGSAFDLESRLHEHKKSLANSAKLMQAVNKAGIGWSVSRYWRGGRSDERRLKTLGGAARLCPVCTPGTKWGGKVPGYKPRHLIESARSESLSYGVRCIDCGEWETACSCPTEAVA